jgi:hypothetical protein
VIATTLYRGLARPLFRALSGSVSVITKVLIDLSPTSSGHYTLGTAFQPAGNFEIEFDLITTDNDRAGLTAAINSAHTFLRMEGDGTLRLKPNPESSPMNSTTTVNDGKSNKIKMVGGPTGCSLYINGFFETSDSQDWSDFGIVELGRRGDGDYLDGIMSKIKMINVDTPANSLEFKLDQLTANTETNNGVTLTYQNIGTGTSVRDTYVLSNGGTQLVSDLRTIDIAAQA